MHLESPAALPFLADTEGERNKESRDLRGKPTLQVATMLQTSAGPVSRKPAVHVRYRFREFSAFPLTCPE